MLAKVTRPMIYEWAAKNYFSVIRVINTVRIPREEFEHFLEKHKEEGANVKHGINKRKKRKVLRNL